MTKLSAADLMVIHNTLYKSLSVVGNSIWTQETRERVMDKVSIIMEQMNAEVVCGDVEPIVVSGDVEEPKKPETLYGIIADWWDEIFLNNNEAAETIESLVDRIEKEWLPKEQSAAGSQNAYVECSVEGFNDCLTKIKRKLR
jgi:hypothetical protein